MLLGLRDGGFHVPGAGEEGEVLLVPPEIANMTVCLVEIPMDGQCAVADSGYDPRCTTRCGVGGFSPGNVPIGVGVHAWCGCLVCGTCRPPSLLTLLG